MAFAVGVPPASEPEGPQELIEAGRVGRAHGLDGSFYVTRAIAPLLVLGSEVQIAGRRTTIVRRAGVDERPIVRVEAVGDRDGAEALRGQALLATPQAAPDLEADEYWAHDLEGCAVVAGGAPVGIVTRLIKLPSCEALEVSLSAGGEMLVPLVRDAIEDIDIGAQRIAVNLAFLGVEG